MSVLGHVGVLAFLVSWGNFLDPLIYLYDRDLFTLPLALKSLAQLDRTNYPLLLAGAVTATAPVIAFVDASVGRRIQPGMLICFTALGAGLHWGAALYRA